MGLSSRQFIRGRAGLGSVLPPNQWPFGKTEVVGFLFFIERQSNTHIKYSLFWVHELTAAKVKQLSLSLPLDFNEICTWTSACTGAWLSSFWWFSPNPMKQRGKQNGCRQHWEGCLNNTTFTSLPNNPLSLICAYGSRHVVPPLSHSSLESYPVSPFRLQFHHTHTHHNFGSPQFHISLWLFVVVEKPVCM